MPRWLALLICPFASGCLAFGYPNVTATAPAVIDSTDVRAFRVTSESTFGGAIIAGWIQLGKDIEEIPVTSSVPSQSDASWCYWCMMFPFGRSHHREVKLLLYRPGYETVELPAEPWWRFAAHRVPAPVVWKRAVSLAAQAGALAAFDAVGHHSFTGLSSVGVLRFLAGEYERLVQAATDAADAKLCDELTGWLTDLRERIASLENAKAEPLAK